MVGLTDLPPELVHQIYDDLRELEDDERASRTWAPVCRALLPFTQAYLYRSLRFTDSVRVAQFIRTVNRSDFLGGYVREIAFNLYDEPPAPGRPTPTASLKGSDRMWPRLSDLRELRIVNSSALLPGLLSISTETTFESLSHVAVWDYFAGNIDPYDLVAYRALLSAAPNLKSLEIGIDDDFPLARSNILQLSTAAPAHSNLTSLTLHGYRPSHILSIAHVANSFPALKTLALFEFCDEGEFPPVLPLLNLPQLTTLSINSMRETVADRPHWQSLDLTRFPNLETLNLNSGDCLASFSVALPPKLKKIEFGRWTDVPLSHLIRLVNARDELHAPSVRDIELNCIRSKVGTSVLSTRGYPKLLPDGNIIYEPHRDWVLPRWTENLSAEKLEEFLAMAKKAGVQVTGTTLEGLEVQRLWAEETEAIRRAEMEALSRRVSALGSGSGRGPTRAAGDESSDSEWDEW